DQSGQLVTGSMMDYALPKADMLPMYETDRTETPTPVNPLGIKGAGETGTIAATPAVVNAVVDALSGLGVDHIEAMPLTRERRRTTTQAAQKKKKGSRLAPTPVRVPKAPQGKGSARSPRKVKGRAQASGGRPHPAPRHEAPPRPAQAPDRHRQGDGAQRDQGGRRHPGHRRLDYPLPDRELRPAQEQASAPARARGLHRRSHSAQPGH